jgi:hypothetical protein
VYDAKFLNEVWAAKSIFLDGTETVPSRYFYFLKAAMGKGLGDADLFLQRISCARVLYGICSIARDIVVIRWD